MNILIFHFFLFIYYIFLKKLILHYNHLYFIFTLDFVKFMPDLSVLNI